MRSRIKFGMTVECKVKKFIFFLSIFLLFSTFLIAQEDDENEIPEEEKIDLQEEYDCYTCYRALQDGVNVRNEPNTHCKILGELSEGDEIYVNKRFNVGRWLFCYVPKYDIIAYCSSRVVAYKPFIYEIMKELIRNDYEAVEMVKNYYVQTYPLDLLLSNYLKDKDEETCLRIVKLAYDCGCDYDSDKSTCLIQAANRGFYRLMEYLLSKEKFLDEIDTMNNAFGTPLFTALYNGNYDIARLLLKNGADPNITTIYDWTMVDTINAAVTKGKASVENAARLKELLLAHGYNPQQDECSSEEMAAKHLP